MDEADENIGKIALGLDVVQFAGLYQRGDDGPIFSTIIVTGKESILARQSLWAHRTLDDVGVELDAAIVEEAGEAVPVPETVADDPGCIRSAREPRELVFEEAPECIDERTRSCLARDTALIGTCAAHILLDDVDLRNARHGFSGDRRIAALGDLKEFTPQVAPAKGDCDPLRRQLLVRGIAVALHDAAIVCEQPHEMLAASPRRVGIGDSRRVGSAPGPVITRDRPEVAGVLPRPGSSTGTGVSSTASLAEVRRVALSRSYSGISSAAA